MTSFTPTVTLSITVGDTVQYTLLPGGTVSGFEVITAVSSALDSTGTRLVYTMTTATRTIKAYAGSIARSSILNNGVEAWVVGQVITA